MANTLPPEQLEQTIQTSALRMTPPAGIDKIRDAAKAIGGNLSQIKQGTQEVFNNAIDKGKERLNSVKNTFKGFRNSISDRAHAAQEKLKKLPGNVATMAAKEVLRIDRSIVKRDILGITSRQMRNDYMSAAEGQRETAQQGVQLVQDLRNIISMSGPMREKLNGIKIDINDKDKLSESILKIRSYVIANEDGLSERKIAEINDKLNRLEASQQNFHNYVYRGEAAQNPDLYLNRGSILQRKFDQITGDVDGFIDNKQTLEQKQSKVQTTIPAASQQTNSGGTESQTLDNIEIAARSEQTSEGVNSELLPKDPNLNPTNQDGIIPARQTNLSANLETGDNKVSQNKSEVNKIKPIIQFEDKVRSALKKPLSLKPEGQIEIESSESLNKQINELHLRLGKMAIEQFNMFEQIRYKQDRLEQLKKQALIANNQQSTQQAA